MKTNPTAVVTLAFPAGTQASPEKGSVWSLHLSPAEMQVLQETLQREQFDSNTRLSLCGIGVRLTSSQGSLWGFLEDVARNLVAKWPRVFLVRGVLHKKRVSAHEKNQYAGEDRGTCQ